MIIAWNIVNALLSVGLAAIVSFILVVWGGSHNLAERMGMGLVGGSVLLTIAPLLVSQPTPFDGWATAVMRFGAILYYAARLQRLVKHRYANTRAKRDAVAGGAGKSRTLKAAENAETAARQTVVEAKESVQQVKKAEQ